MASIGNVKHLSPAAPLQSIVSEGLFVEPCAPTLFHEEWWLDLSSDGNWDCVEVSSGGRVVGRLPYQKTKAFITRLGMPSATYALGPAFQEGKNVPNESKRQAIVRELIAGLPDAAATSFRTYNPVDALAFASAGFVCNVEYTCAISPAPADILWKNMRDKARNVVRRAQECLTLIEHLSPAEFLDTYEANLTARSRANHYDRELILKLITETISRGRGRITATIDETGGVQSAIFTAWDRGREYYLLSTRAANSHNGAVSLALWAAIRHAADHGLIFDFAGLHVQDANVSNHLLFFGLGGEVKPVYRVKRLSLPLALVAAIKMHLTQRRRRRAICQR